MAACGGYSEAGSIASATKTPLTTPRWAPRGRGNRPGSHSEEMGGAHAMPGPFGLMHQMWAPPEVADEDFFRATIEDIVLADELGFDSAWIAEHHYVRPGPVYSPLPDAEV